MEQIFKTVMVTGAGIARPPVRASSIPLWKQYLVFSIFHLEEIQCTQTDPRDDHLNQDKAHLHLQRFSSQSFEFISNYICTIAIDIALKSPSTERWRAYNFSPSNLCGQLTTPDVWRWSTMVAFGWFMWTRWCPMFMWTRWWTLDNEEKDHCRGDNERAGGERWVHNFVQSDLCWQEATNNGHFSVFYGIFSFLGVSAARVDVRSNLWSQHYSVKS